VDTSQTSDFANKPTGWSTPGGGGLHLIATSVTDDQGRTTKSTDANGNSTYMVYDDANHTTMVFPAWNAATHTTTGPIQVMREDRAHEYSESLTTSLSASYNGSGEPTGLSAALSSSNILSLSRTTVNDAGQAIYSDSYFTLAGATYTTSSAAFGSAGTNYDRTETAYDDRGRVKRVKNPVGTITRYLYDSRSHQTQTWIGTDDTPSSGYWSPSNTTGTDLTLVSESEYDKGAAGGDGNLTSSTVHPNDGSADRSTLYAYDWRNRLIATKSGVTGGTEYSTDNTHPVSFGVYDNLGEQLSSTGYDGDEQDIYASGDTLGYVNDPPDDSLRRAYSESSFDELGRVYESRTYSVDPTSGDLSTYFLHSDTWYDDRGNLIKSLSPGGLVSKTVFDSLGRANKSYTTDGGGDPAPGASSNWAAADDVTGDKVLEQVAYTYDNNGNVVLTTSKQRFDDASATGELGDVSTNPKARVSYVVSTYDAANRLTNTADLGTNGGSAPTLNELTVANPGFETPDEGTGSSAAEYNPAGGSWIFAGAAGLAGNGASELAGLPNAPEGDQVAFLQCGGSIIQTMSGWHAGRYVISFDAAGSTDPISVRLDGGVVAQVVPSSAYANYSTAVLSVGAGSHDISFDYNGTLALVDNVHITPATPTIPDRSDAGLVTSYDYAADEVQTINLTGSPTGGTFTLSFGGNTTSSIAYNASASTVQSALQGLGSIGSGNVFVTGSAGKYIIRFAGSKAGINQAQLTASSSLTGGSSPAVAISTTSQGGDNGLLQTTTDPRGIVAKCDYNMLGQQVRSIGAFTDFVPSSADDQTTAYVYDGNGNVTTMTAVMPSGTNSQTTQYVYGVTAGDGNGVTSNDLLKEVRYPDKSTGAAGTSSTDKQQYLYNALGQPIQMTDQNGSVHEYNYDTLGRQTADAVTTVGSGVDDSVLRLETAYNAQGLPYLFTSYDADTGGNVVNQVERVFNGLGQITAEYQEHSDSVDTNTSPVVQYSYSEMDSGANHSRLTSMTYPNGRVLRYEYSSGLDSDISRLSFLADDSSGSVGTHLEEYSYLGLGTIVRAARPEPGTELTYIKRSGESDGDAGDKYIGLDRFGRVADQRWMTSSGGTALAARGRSLVHS
jgi:YD repeat-containing protein